MKRSTVYISVCTVLILGCSSFSLAQDRSPSQPYVYYQMGGGNTISDALNPAVTLSPVTLAPAFKQPSSCEIWENREDLGGYAEKIINDFVKQKMNEFTGLVGQATAIVKAAPQMAVVAVLERSLPGMYDWMNQMTGMINLQLDASLNTCRTATAKTQAGSSIEDAWINVSTNLAWRETLDDTHNWDSDTGHINAVARDIHETARDTDITWFGGDAGATPGSPIEVTKGIISAGYAASASTSYNGATVTGPANVPNTSINPDGTLNASGTRPPRLTTLFPTSVQAVNFAIEVLGEESILYCDDPGCDTTITPGIGLKASYSKERDRLVQEWTSLIQSYPPGGLTNPKILEFEGVSSQTVKITKQVYNVLRNLPPQDRNVYIYKFVSDVAIENTVERALALIEMINSGEKLPEVQSYWPTREKAKELEGIAKQAIENLMYEITIRERLTSNTARLLLEADAAFIEANATINPGSGVPDVNTFIREGEVYRQ